MDRTIERLARHVLASDFARLPPEAVHECRRRLIDSLACAAAASPEPYCARIAAFAGTYHGTPAARLWGSGAPSSIEMAAFANGTLVRYLDQSDTVLSRSGGHPSDMIPALLAVAEAHGRDGAALVAAIVAAYDLYCGLCESVALKAHGLDQATAAAVGAAAGAGRLLGLDEPALGHALSLALSANLNLFNVRCGHLSDWKGSAGPNGARNGVFAALLAREGVSGPSAVVEGQGGLHEVLGAFDWQVARDKMPLIASTHLKRHPVCYHGQSAVDAAIALRGRVRLDDITDIHIETYDAAVRAMGADAARWAPANRETADHSLPYTVAVALQEGRLSSTCYADERLADPGTKRLMDKVRVTSVASMSDEYPARAQARLTLRSAGGEEHVHLQRDPRGHAANPMSDAELEAKFVELYAPWGDTRRARQALDLLWAADSLPRAAAIVDQTLCQENPAP